MVLGHMVAIDARRLVQLDHPEAVFVDLGKGCVPAPVQVIENTEFHIDRRSLIEEILELDLAPVQRPSLLKIT